MQSPEFRERIRAPKTIIPPDTSFDVFYGILEEAGIPLAEYGAGQAKTLQNLHTELSQGESVLRLDKKGKLTREVNVLWVDVLCEMPDGSVYIIREDRQEFKDGRIRNRKLDGSIGEKIKPNETLEEAVVRAMSEELGLRTMTSLYKFDEETRTFFPPTFPGIESTYNMTRFVTSIPPEDFAPEGYIEVQPEKTNYYVWDRIK